MLVLDVIVNGVLACRAGLEGRSTSALITRVVDPTGLSGARPKDDSDGFHVSVMVARQGHRGMHEWVNECLLDGDRVEFVVRRLEDPDPSEAQGDTP